MRVFVKDRNFIHNSDGQTILNASIYADLLHNGARHGPPCLFTYPTQSNRDSVREALGRNLWLNGFGCTTYEQSNEVYSLISYAPFMPGGRLRFVIATVEGETTVDACGDCLMKQVGGSSSLDQSQKSGIGTLLSQKESLRERALE